MCIVPWPWLEHGPCHPRRHECRAKPAAFGSTPVENSAACGRFRVAVPLQRPAAEILPMTRQPPTVAAIRALQRRQRIGLWRYITRASAATAFTAPVVYSLLLPFAVLDLWVTVYQVICFRAWGVKLVRRRDFFVIDRHRLPYLNALEKLNCVYCSYANGVIAYVREIAARTEQYWCPIRHARRVRGSHDRYGMFVPYGDAASYRTRLAEVRGLIQR
jgi:hypothetical protein